MNQSSRPSRGRRARLGATTVLLTGTALWSASALAQGSDMNAMLNRLNRLENEVQTLNRQVYRGGVAGAPVVTPAMPPGGNAGAGGVPSSLAADFEVRLTRLERELQQLTGRYEEAAFGVAQLRERMEKLQNDLDYRLSEIESKLSAEHVAVAPSGAVPAPAAQPPAKPTAGAPQAAAVAPPAKPGTAAPAPPATPNKPASTPAPQPQPSAAAAGSLPAGNAQEQYDQAFGLLRNADYAKAEVALAQFLKNHSGHSLAPNAQYWLAETYYVRQKFKDAAITFAEGYQKNPKGPKAPDSLLKLGMSLAAMNQKDDACLTFAQLSKEFPDVSANVKRRAEQERSRLGCS